MNHTDTTPSSAPTGTPARADQPGLILYVHPADGPPAQAYTGLASLELSVAIGENTVFNLGSVAKQITAYLLVLGARDGTLALDRPVTDILPRFRIPEVTLGDLIHHHGGIRDAESLLSLAGFRDLDHYTADDLLELAYRQTRRAVEPGRFLYSNTGYLLLAEVLRHVHGSGVQDVADREVFAPLGMSSARFKSDPREVITGAASSYGAADAGWTHQQRPVALPGPGSLWCTAADLDRWLAHLSQEWRLASEDALPFERHVGYRPSDHRPFTYGAGLYADSRTGNTSVFHYGHEQGFSAAVHLAQAGLRVICLSNHAGIPADHVATHTIAEFTRRRDPDLDQILAHVTVSVSSMPNPRPDSAPAEPHKLIGVYVCEEVPGTVRLSLSGGSLHLWRRGTHDRLTRTAAATYTAKGYSLTLAAHPMGDGEARVDDFVLNLDRAPGLHYRRRPV